MALHYAGLYTSGVMSQDTLHLGDLSIEAQHFEEALELRPAPGYWGDIFDGVLGLAPPSGTRNMLHPLSLIVSQGLLDKNVFGLRFPSDDNTGGELTLGGTKNDSYTDDLITIPTTCEPDPWLHGKWTVDARFAWLGNGDTVNKNLSGYTAFFDSGYPFIDLPRSLAVEVLNLIDAKPGNSLVLTVPCSKRDELPDLTFQLNDANITLTAFKYTIEDDGECAVMIDGHQEHEGEKPYLRLGSSFLKGFYSVFDIERKTVGCKCPTIADLLTRGRRLISILSSRQSKISNSIHKAKHWSTAYVVRWSMDLAKSDALSGKGYDLVIKFSSLDLRHIMFHSQWEAAQSRRQDLYSSH